MSTFVTGDCHGRFEKFSSDNFPQGKNLTKEDYVIILGDAGLVWDYTGESKNEAYWLDWLNSRPWTTLFIDGNHENFTRLNTYPVSAWHGGSVHVIRPSVFHLMRGQVFEIEGKTFFTFGGARSHDISDGVLDVGDPRIKEWQKDVYKMFRIRNVSWWEEELPSAAEMIEGIDNLGGYCNKVDFILTHCAPTSIHILFGYRETDKLTDYLDDIRANVQYGVWFCGHYHRDKYDYTNHFSVLYDIVERIV